MDVTFYIFCIKDEIKIIILSKEIKKKEKEIRMFINTLHLLNKTNVWKNNFNCFDFLTLP